MTSMLDTPKQTEADMAWGLVAEAAADLAMTVAPFTGGAKRSMLEQVEQLVSKHGGLQLAEAFARFARATEKAQSCEDPCGVCHGHGERDYGKGQAAYVDVCDACAGRGYDL